MVDGEVMIIDEFTGRILEGRRWSEGLHQAVEAKEGVAIREENQTLATITLQNYFRLYDKLSGMTGTALTEATEFMKIYKIAGGRDPDQPADGPRRPQRPDLQDQGRQVEGGASRRSTARHETGQPILVGTVSVEVSEMISERAEAAAGSSTRCSTPSPSTPSARARSIAQAGRRGAVMIATNMAGRGVDIKLGGDPEHLADARAEEAGPQPGDEGYEEALAAKIRRARAARARPRREEVRELGGLFICGTERHESRRIDNQLRGRSGRQGDPGESRFFLSAEDDLIRLFAGDRIYKILDRLGPDRRGGRGGAARGEDADEADRERPEEGRGAELPDPQARARVRRRDERAAPRRLQVPRRDPRGPRHVRRRPRARSRA